MGRGNPYIPEDEGVLRYLEKECLYGDWDSDFGDYTCNKWVGDDGEVIASQESEFLFHDFCDDVVDCILPKSFTKHSNPNNYRRRHDEYSDYLVLASNSLYDFCIMDDDARFCLAIIINEEILSGNYVELSKLLPLAENNLRQTELAIFPKIQKAYGKLYCRASAWTSQMMDYFPEENVI